MSQPIEIEDNRVECPTCEGSGEVSARGGNSGDWEVANEDGNVGCPRCGMTGYIELEDKEFGQLKVGDVFLSDIGDRTIVFKKIDEPIFNAVTQRDPKGIYTGAKHCLGLLAPVKVEK